MSEHIKVSIREPRILVCGDIHFPYASQSALQKVYNLCKEFQPNVVVQIGDLYDQYNFSRYPKEADMLPQVELLKARKQAEVFWGNFHDVENKFQVRGNHDQRMIKKVRSQAPELYSMVKKSWDDMYKFPEVRTLDDERSELVINDILFIHGYLSNLGDHLKTNRQSTVVGHSHRGGMVCLRHKSKTLFELNVGHLADDRKLPFSYTPQRTTFWTPGVGLIDDKGPRFVAF